MFFFHAICSSYLRPGDETVSYRVHISSSSHSANHSALQARVKVKYEMRRAQLPGRFECVFQRAAAMYSSPVWSFVLRVLQVSVASRMPLHAIQVSVV